MLSGHTAVSWSRRKVIGVLIVLLLLSLAGIGMSQVLKNEDAVPRPPILFIVLETGRADHVGPCYGYHRETAPNMCGVASDGVLFEEAYAQGTWTLVALPTLLSSQHPRRVRLRNLFTHPLPENVTTIIEVARDHGYNTTGIDVHFRMYTSGILNKSEMAEYPSASTVNLSGQRFWWFMPMDMHAPYYPADRYRLWDNLSQTDLPQKDPDEWRSLKKNLSVPELKSLYDAEMRSADDRIGTIIHRLKEENRYRESLIIITADHGEMFGEHGHPNLTGAYMAEHSGPPFQELIHVPLIIKLPRNMFAGTTVTQPVRHLDVVPTMLEVLAIPQAAIDPMGTSLIPAITGQQLNVTVFAAGSRMDWLADPEEAEQQWGSFDPQFRAYWGIKSGAWKYIGKSFCMGGDNTSKLFNLKKDPTEQQNVVHSYPETAADLRQSLCQVYKQGRPVMKAPSDFPANVDVPSNIREMLEDLGYLQ